MSMLDAVVSAFLQRPAKGAARPLRLTTGLGSLAVSQVEGPGDDATRAGVRFHASAIGATGIAPVQAIPTTAAQWLLYNPTANTKTLFVDRLGVVLNSGTAGAGGTLLAAICKAVNCPATVPVANASGVVVSNASPASSNSTLALLAASQTLQNSTGLWRPVAWMSPAGTVLGQTQLDSGDLGGSFAIPPGCGIGLAVISPTGTSPLFAAYASWREYATDLE